MDEQQKVRTITALAIAALAESATPYGIESFDSVLKPLWKGIKQHRGKVCLSVFLITVESGLGVEFLMNFLEFFSSDPRIFNVILIIFVSLLIKL